MTKKETAKILHTLRVFYPAFFRELGDSKQVAEMVEEWSRVFAKDDFSDVSQAVDSLARESKFMPAVSEIAERAEEFYRARQPRTRYRIVSIGGRAFAEPVPEGGDQT